MRRPTPRWPATTVVSLAAAAATWVALLSWTPFAERPSIYMAPLLFACLLVAATGALLRTGRLPAIVVALAQVLMLGLWLHHRWAGAEAWGGWLPTPESVEQVRLTLLAAGEAAREYPAPVPREVPELAPLMISAGAATAVLVDLIACGLRRAPVAGLPLLAVYTAPVSILDGGVSWLKFAAAAMCFLLLLAAQESVRLAHWGQQVSAPGLAPDPVATGQAVWSSARKIGLSATGLAVIVPLMVPTLSLRLFDGTGPGGGSDSVSLSNPIVNMRRDLSRGRNLELLRIRTQGDPSYLRTTVLDSFDGETWKPSRRQIPSDQGASGLLPRPPGLDADVERRTDAWTVEVSDSFESRWLPVPYPSFSINAAGDWRYDTRTLDFISADDGQTTAGLTYTLEGVQLSPTAEQLRRSSPAPADVFGPSTELPDQMPEIVDDLAREVTAGAQNKYEQAQALQRWFRLEGGFSYSLEPAAGNGIDDTVRFLTPGGDGRVGYCEQFAATMALMARSLDIPARVAVGFLRPEKTGDGEYVYRSHDLHAWPELYFEGNGWVRFEPTPAVRTGDAPGYTQGGPEDQEEPATPEQSDDVVPDQNRFEDPAVPTDSAADASGGGATGARDLLAVAAIVALALALAGAPRGLRTWVRRRRWSRATSAAALAEASWDELRDTAIDLGVAWSDTVTLRTRARDLVHSFGNPHAGGDALTRAAERGAGAYPDATDALERIVQRLEVARYARPGVATAAARSDAEHDVALCRAALTAGAAAARRTRARWLPASLVDFRRTGRRTLRVGPTVDEAGVDHAV